MLRKGLFLCFLYVLNIGKKGPFLEGCQHFRKKGYFLSIFTGKELFFGASSQRFSIKGVLFSPGKISDRGIFLI